MKTKLSEIFDLTFKMASVTRYSQTRMVNRESVLEHSGFVCMMSYYLSKKFIPICGEINVGEMLEKAILHDVEEIITGDIPRPTKHYNEEVKNALQKIERESMIIISSSIEIDSMYATWETSKENAEGAIVRLSDCLAVVWKIWSEAVMYGNKTVVDHASGCSSNLDEIYSILIVHFEEEEVRKVILEAKEMCDKINRS